MDDIEINDLRNLGDLAIWLHDNGWVASNDAQWTRVAPLWNELDHLRAEVALLTAEIAWIHHAASWLKNNNVNPRAWQCIQDIIDRSTQDGK